MTDLEEVRKLERQLRNLKESIEAKEAERTRNQSAGADDVGLLTKCLDVLQYATYHDGRYAQVDNLDKFQWPAQKLVVLLAARLNVKPYAGYGG